MTVKETKEIKEFFHTLFHETEGFIEIRTISNIGKTRQEYYSTRQIEQLVNRIVEEKSSYLNDNNVYFGVCPREKREGKEKNIEQVNCLWIDLDCKSEKERLEALKRLRGFGLAPSIIISSGNGFHAYWLLNRPYQIKTEKNRLKAKGCLKGLSLYLGGDMVFDLSRILRVPGTKNVKNPNNPLPVEMLEFDNKKRYEFEEFEQFRLDIEQTTVPIDITLDKIPDRFWRILEDNEKFKATWERKRKDLKDESRSGYDMALADLLVLCGFSGGEIAAILTAVPYNEDKKLTKPYLSYTIGKALAGMRGDTVDSEENKVVQTADVFTLDNLLDTFRKWLELEETDYIEIVLATLLSNEIPGDPVWIFVVGPPGASKTEVLRSFAGLGDRIYSTSKLTPQSLISGKQTDKYDPSLLPKLDGKTLIIKDFTSILGMRSEAREIIFSDLREAYDGYLDKDFGNIGHKGYESHFSLIANVTPVIDKYTSVQQTLGERFLKIRLKEVKMDAKIAKALDNEDKQEEMRKELAEAVRRFYEQKFEIDMVGFPDRVKVKVVQLAKLVAICRTSVSRDPYRQNTLTYLPEYEVGTRIGIQLKKLARSLACIRGRKEVGEDEVEVLRRVSQDTLAKKTKVLLDFLHGHSDEWLTTAEVTEKSRIEYQTCRFSLQDLQVLGLLETRKEEHMQGSPWSWKLSLTIKELIDGTK